MACKHRLRLFEGDITDLEGGVVDKVSQLAEMLTGTEVEIAINQLKALEDRKLKINKEINSEIMAAKNQLGIALWD